MELFLSHATANAKLVGEVASRLASMGIRVYAAEHDNKAGENVHDKLQAAIRRCDLVIVLLTEPGHESPYVHQEIGFAKAANKLVVPIVTPSVARKPLGMLEGLEYIVLDESDPAAALQLLSQRMEKLAVTQKVKDEQRDDYVMLGVALVSIGVILLLSGS